VSSGTKHILVVDDEPTIRDLVADALHDAGFHVATAANGADALHAMQRQLPHAVVLDLMMPQLDAQGFVELKRLNPRFEPVPILVVTAAYAAYEAAERLGADACLAKPFELDELVESVAQLVGEPEAARPIGHADRPSEARPEFAAEA
jgi:two-component system, response regulator, stage 0 sporulation protein F